MSWFRKLLPPKIKTSATQAKKAVPEGLWSKCPSCEAVLYFTDLENSLRPALRNVSNLTIEVVLATEQFAQHLCVVRHLCENHPVERLQDA